MPCIQRHTWRSCRVDATTLVHGLGHSALAFERVVTPWTLPHVDLVILVIGNLPMRRASVSYLTRAVPTLGFNGSVPALVPSDFTSGTLFVKRLAPKR